MAFNKSQLANDYRWIFEDPNFFNNINYELNTDEMVKACDQVARISLNIPKEVLNPKSMLVPKYIEEKYQVGFSDTQKAYIEIVKQEYKDRKEYDEKVDGIILQYSFENLYQEKGQEAVDDVKTRLYGTNGTAENPTEDSWVTRNNSIRRDQIDSFRHVFQAAYMSMRHGEEEARTLSYAHEVTGWRDSVQDHNQDFWNNEIGYAIAKYAKEKGYSLDKLPDLINKYYSENVKDPDFYRNADKYYNKKYDYVSDVIIVDMDEGYFTDNKRIYNGEPLWDPETNEKFVYPETYLGAHNDPEFAKILLDIRETVYKSIDSIFGEINNPFYRIKKGDTLWDIAQKYGCTVEDLLKSNSWLFEKNRVSKDHTYVLIHPGELLNMPINTLYKEQASKQNKQITQISTQYNASQRYYDPLTFDLDSDGIETINLNDSQVYFDLNADGFKEQTGWVSKDDGILIVDENNNGLVDDINELFGNTSINGFEEIKLSNTNNDGKIDSNDTNFSKMKIWQDLNENGISEAGELKSLTELGIKSIDLNYQPVKAA